MIRIDALWLAAEPVDMRAGAERLLARVVQVFGCAQAHHGYLFANARGTRIKLLVHDGFGVWCAARRLNQGRFAWPREASGATPPMTLTQPQFDALVLGAYSGDRERRFRPIVNAAAACEIAHVNCRRLFTMGPNLAS